MTLLQRARLIAEATEQLQIAAKAWTNTPSDASDYLRVNRATELSERAVKYTQALQAFAKNGAK